MSQSQRGREGPTATSSTRTVPPDGRPSAEQPRWRQDFPIDWAQDEYVSRRELVKFLVLTSVAFVVGQVWIVLKSALRARQSEAIARRSRSPRVDELPVGGAKTFTYPRRQHAEAPGANGRDRVRRLRPAVHAPAVPGGAGGRAGPASLPLPQRLVRPRDRPARCRARRSARCRASRSNVRDGTRLRDRRRGARRHDPRVSAWCARSG